MTRAQKSARAQYSKFHRVPVYLTDAEWGALSAEAYSREISRAEFIRRAVEHFRKTAMAVKGIKGMTREELTRRAVAFFFECQGMAIEAIIAPPPRWRMPRATLTG